jgi:NDP-sugar pyrophosphorylase family protein
MVRSPSGPLEDFGNSCVQVIHSEFLDFFPKTEPRSLTEMYLQLAERQKIGAYIHNEDYWFDLGRYENFIIADKKVF